MARDKRYQPGQVVNSAAHSGEEDSLSHLGRRTYSWLCHIRRFSRGFLPGRHLPMRPLKSHRAEPSGRPNLAWRSAHALAFLPYARSLRVRFGFAARRKQR